MKKRLLFTLTGINLLLVSSISMSLAWFLQSDKLIIENIVLTVDADADILISTTDSFDDAKHQINYSDVDEMGKFQPISSMGIEHSDWINDPTINSPVFSGPYIFSNSQNPVPNVASSGYFSKTLYLFSTRTMYATFDFAGTYVRPSVELNESKALKKANDIVERTYLDVANERISQQGITGEDDKAQLIEEVKSELLESYKTQYLKELNSIEDSLRISLLDRNNLTQDGPFTVIDPHKKENEETVFGGRLNTSSTDNYYDYYTDHDTNEVKEVVFGDIKSQDHEIVYKDAQQTDRPVVGTPTCFNAGTKAGVKELDMEDLESNVEFYKEQSISCAEADVSVTDNMNQGYLIKLEPRVPHPVNLSIYIEGWDLDNTNCTQDGSFEMAVKFKLYREAGM